MGYSLGGNLTRELNKRNNECDNVTQKLAEVTTELKKTKKDNQNLTQENLRLTQKNTTDH
jgi:septal ring factor EnvC (AmiA/AmiB activator)